MQLKPPSISPSKKIRETQEMDLRREMEILKDELYNQVDALIMRANTQEPNLKVETFQIETASRRVLKELTETYVAI